MANWNSQMTQAQGVTIGSTPMVGTNTGIHIPAINGIPITNITSSNSGILLTPLTTYSQANIKNGGVLYGASMISHEDYVGNDILSINEFNSTNKSNNVSINQNKTIFDFVEVNDPMIIDNHGVEVVYQDINGQTFNNNIYKDDNIYFALSYTYNDTFNEITEPYNIFRVYPTLSKTTYYVYKFEDIIRGETSYRRYNGNVVKINDNYYGTAVPYYANLIETNEIEESSVEISSYKTSCRKDNANIVLKEITIPRMVIDSNANITPYITTPIKIDNGYELYGNKLSGVDDQNTVKNILSKYISSYSLLSPLQLISEENVLDDYGHKTERKNVYVDSHKIFKPVIIYTYYTGNSYEYIPYDTINSYSDNTVEVSITRDNSIYKITIEADDEHNKIFYYEDDQLYADSDLNESIAPEIIADKTYYELSGLYDDSQWKLYMNISSLIQDEQYNYIEIDKAFKNVNESNLNTIIYLLTATPHRTYENKIPFNQYNVGKTSLFTENKIKVNEVYEEYNSKMTYIEFIQQMSTTYNLPYVSNVEYLTGYTFDPNYSSIEYRNDILFEREGLEITYQYYSPQTNSYDIYTNPVLSFNNVLYGTTYFDTYSDVIENNLKLIEVFERTRRVENANNAYLIKDNDESTINTYTIEPLVLTNDYNYVLDNYEYVQPEKINVINEEIIAHKSLIEKSYNYLSYIITDNSARLKYNQRTYFSSSKIDLPIPEIIDTIQNYSNNTSYDINVLEYNSYPYIVDSVKRIKDNTSKYCVSENDLYRNIDINYITYVLGKYGGPFETSLFSCFCHIVYNYGNSYMIIEEYNSGQYQYTLYELNKNDIYGNQSEQVISLTDEFIEYNENDPNYIVTKNTKYEFDIEDNWNNTKIKLYNKKITIQYNQTDIKNYSYTEQISKDGYWKRNYQKEIKPLLTNSYSTIVNDLNIANAYVVPSVKNERLGFIHNHKISYNYFKDNYKDEYVFTYFAEDTNLQQVFVENEHNKIVSLGDNKFVGIKREEDKYYNVGTVKKDKTVISNAIYNIESNVKQFSENEDCKNNVYLFNEEFDLTFGSSYILIPTGELNNDSYPHAYIFKTKKDEDKLTLSSLYTTKSCQLTKENGIFTITYNILENFEKNVDYKDELHIFNSQIVDLHRRLNVTKTRTIEEQIVQEDEYVPQCAQIDAPFGLVNGKKVTVIDQVYVPEAYETVLTIDPVTYQYTTKRYLKHDAYMAYTYEVSDIPFLTATYIFNNDEGIKIQGLDKLIERLTPQQLSEEASSSNPSSTLYNNNSESQGSTKIFENNVQNSLNKTASQLVYINEAIDRNTKQISYAISYNNDSTLANQISHISDALDNQNSINSLNISNFINAQKSMVSKLTNSLENQTKTLTSAILGINGAYASYGANINIGNLFASSQTSVPKNWVAIYETGYQYSSYEQVTSYHSISYKHTKVIGKEQRVSNVKEVKHTYKHPYPKVSTNAYTSAVDRHLSDAEKIGLHLEIESQDFIENGIIYKKDSAKYYNIADILADLHISKRLPTKKEFIIDVSTKLYINSDFIFAYTSPNEYAIRAIRRADILWSELAKANIVDDEGEKLSYTTIINDINTAIAKDEADENNSGTNNGSGNNNTGGSGNNSGDNNDSGNGTNNGPNIDNGDIIQNEDQDNSLEYPTETATEAPTPVPHVYSFNVGVDKVNADKLVIYKSQIKANGKDYTDDFDIYYNPEGDILKVYAVERRPSLINYKSLNITFQLDCIDNIMYSDEVIKMNIFGTPVDYHYMEEYTVNTNLFSIMPDKSKYGTKSNDDFRRHVYDIVLTKKNSLEDVDIENFIIGVEDVKEGGKSIFDRYYVYEKTIGDNLKKISLIEKVASNRELYEVEATIWCASDEFRDKEAIIFTTSDDNNIKLKDNTIPIKPTLQMYLGYINPETYGVECKGKVGNVVYTGEVSLYFLSDKTYECTAYPAIVKDDDKQNYYLYYEYIKDNSRNGESKLLFYLISKKVKKHSTVDELIEPQMTVKCYDTNIKWHTDTLRPWKVGEACKVEAKFTPTIDPDKIEEIKHPYNEYIRVYTVALLGHTLGQEDPNNRIINLVGNRLRCTLSTNKENKDILDNYEYIFDTTSTPYAQLILISKERIAYPTSTLYLNAKFTCSGIPLNYLKLDNYNLDVEYRIPLTCKETKGILEGESGIESPNPNPGTGLSPDTGIGLY